MWLIGMNVVYFCFGVTLISLSSWGIQQSHSGTGLASSEDKRSPRLRRRPPPPPAAAAESSGDGDGAGPAAATAGLPTVERPPRPYDGAAALAHPGSPPLASCRRRLVLGRRFLVGK